MTKEIEKRFRVTLICARGFEERHKGDMVVANAFAHALSKFTNLSIICLSSIEGEYFLNINDNNVKVFNIKVPQLLEIIVDLIKSLFSSRPLQYALFSNKRIKKKVIKHLTELGSDATISITSRAWAMHLGGVGKYNYVHLVDALSINFDLFANIQKRYFKRMFYKIEARRLKKDEENIDSDASCVWQVAIRDNENDKPERIIIPIVYSFTNNMPPKEKNPKNEIVFLGTLSYWPNIEAIHWFVDNVFPFIRESLPNITFKIAGKGKNKLHPRINLIPGVEVFGPVTNSIEFLSQGKVIVVPVHKGTGMQNKILEAGWLGKEIVCTKFSAEPFNEDCKKMLRIADNPQEFADQVIKAINNPRPIKNMEEWAEKVKGSYSVEILQNKLKEILSADLFY